MYVSHWNVKVSALSVVFEKTMLSGEKKKVRIGYLYCLGVQEGAKYLMHFICQKTFCSNILSETVGDDEYNNTNLNFHSFYYQS